MLRSRRGRRVFFPARPSRLFPDGLSRGAAAFSAEVGGLSFSGSEAPFPSGSSSGRLSPAPARVVEEKPNRNVRSGIRFFCRRPPWLPPKGARERRRGGRLRFSGRPGLGRGLQGQKDLGRQRGPNGSGFWRSRLTAGCNPSCRPDALAFFQRPRGGGFGVPGLAGKELPAAPRRPGETG